MHPGARGVIRYSKEVVYTPTHTEGDIVKKWKIAALCTWSLAEAQTPADLFRSVRDNDLKTLKTADLTVRDERGNTLLTFVASFGTPEAVKLLLDRGADVEAKNQFEATALILGAADPVKARLLISKGANVNVVSKFGREARQGFSERCRKSTCPPLAIRGEQSSRLEIRRHSGQGAVLGLLGLGCGQPSTVA